jgi:hypothetical protein
MPWWRRGLRCGICGCHLDDLQHGICHKRCLPLDQLEHEHWWGCRGGGRQQPQLLNMKIKVCVHRLQQRKDTIQLGWIQLGEDGGGCRIGDAGHDGDVPR